MHSEYDLSFDVKALTRNRINSWIARLGGVLTFIPVGYWCFGAVGASAKVSRYSILNLADRNLVMVVTE